MDCPPGGFRPPPLSPSNIQAPPSDPFSQFLPLGDTQDLPSFPTPAAPAFNPFASGASGDSEIHLLTGECFLPVVSALSRDSATRTSTPNVHVNLHLMSLSTADISLTQRSEATRTVAPVTPHKLVPEDLAIENISWDLRDGTWFGECPSCGKWINTGSKVRQNLGPVKAHMRGAGCRPLTAEQLEIQRAQHVRNLLFPSPAPQPSVLSTPSSHPLNIEVVTPSKIDRVLAEFRCASEPCPALVHA